VIKAGRLPPLISYRESAVAKSDSFKWRHYQGKIIILCVRWYLRYAFSYCDLEEMMRERDLSVDHTGSAYLASAYALKMHSVYRPASAVLFLP
jgi:transposase, IS6 family